jgi:hypothetical protein
MTDKVQEIKLNAKHLCQKQSAKELYDQQHFVEHPVKRK